MKQTDIKYFSGSLNADDAIEFAGKGDFLNAVNLLMAPGEDKENAVFRKRKSTVEISNSLPSGVNTCYGGCVDEEAEVVIFFNKNSNGNHGIYAYVKSIDSIKTVLLQSESAVPIIGSAVIQSVVDHGQLYWTTGSGEPLRINYKAAIKSHFPSFSYDWSYDMSSPLAGEVLYIIRDPMSLPITLEKKNDTSYPANFIADQSVMFFTRYSFIDGEVSVLSPGSKLANYNESTSFNNYIRLTLPPERVNQDVKIIELVVRFANTNKFYVIKTWDRDEDAAEIAAHNSGTPLTFDYYGDISGYPISGVKPFDSVPQDVKTIEVGRNRLWLANYKEGFDTPKKTSLTSSVIEVENGSALTGSWVRLHIDIYNFAGTVITSQRDVWVFRVTGNNPLYYYYSSIVWPSIPPINVSFSSASMWTNNIIDIIRYLGYGSYITTNFLEESTYTSTVIDSVGDVYNGMSIFKSNSSVQLGVVFGGVGRRRCGVVTTDANKVSTPARSYSQTVYNRGVSWTLSNADSVNEIPEWATHYWIVRTLNLSTRFYIQCNTKAVKYVNKAENNTYTYSYTYSLSNYGLALDISALPSYGMGYLFSDGDLVTYYSSAGGSPYKLRIIGQDGPYIHCSLANLGDTSSAKGLIDIYTPYKKTENEIFYAIGSCYEIDKPGTANRKYTTIGGDIMGDSYLVLREGSTPTQHFVEAMSSNDKFWTEWNTDCYEPHIITKLGRTEKPNHFRHSAKHLYGTQNNGMSSFEALDEDNVPVESGGITVLKLASKAQEDGSVLLAIGKFRTSSIYIGESQLVSNQGNAFITKSDGVIGTVNPLQGSYGTTHPESVAMFNGGIFWYDQFNGAIIQYSQSGLFPISEYKMAGPFLKMSKDGSQSLWPGAVDLSNKEFLISRISTGGAYYKESFNSISGRADTDMSRPEDASGTWAFKIGGDKWSGSWQFIGERYLSLGLTLFVFKGGKLYTFTGPDYNKFFGTQYDSVLCFTSNEGPDEKEYRAISVYSDEAPDATYVYTERPNKQITSMVKDDFTKLNGVFSSPIYFDRLSPNTPGTADEKMYSGDVMVSPAMKFQLHFSGTQDLRLKFVEINYNNSLGVNKRQ